MEEDGNAILCVVRGSLLSRGGEATCCDQGCQIGPDFPTNLATLTLERERERKRERERERLGREIWPNLATLAVMLLVEMDQCSH